MRVRQLGQASALAIGTTAVLLVTACGGADSGEVQEDPGTGQNAFSAYLDCMRENGVEMNVPDMGAGRPSGFPTDLPSGFPTDLPSRGAGGRPTDLPSGQPSGPPGGGRGGPGGMMGQPEGVDDATWQAAQEACQSLQPSGGPGGGARPNGTADADGTDGTSAAYQNCLRDRDVTVTDLDASDPTVVAALEACKVLSPAPSPPGE